MLTLKSCETLDYLNNPAWTDLARSVLGEKIHPERIKSFCFAREALRLALRELNEAPGVSDLVLDSYHSLARFPDYTVSLSHTRNMGVALVGRRKDFRSLGVDVEELNRQVKEEIITKVSHPEDAKLRNIEMWVLKEAAFKCLENSGIIPSQVLFTDLRISRDSWLHSPTGLQGDCELRQVGPHLLGLATLKP